MKRISRNLPQFEKYPTLFITSGEFDARFYIALDGTINEEKRIRMNPREEAREKQGMIKESHGKELGAFSHHGKYM